MSRMIKSVAYGYYEGFPKPYAFDALYVRDGELALNIHKTFETQAELFDEIEQVIPIFVGGDPNLTSETVEVVVGGEV